MGRFQCAAQRHSAGRGPLAERRHGPRPHRAKPTGGSKATLALRAAGGAGGVRVTAGAAAVR
jgi:hypothetical protein